MAKDEEWKTNIQPYLYRPFDHAWIFASPSFVHRLRLEVMRHFEEENLGLCVGRAGLVVQGDWNLVFCTGRICDHNLFYRGSSLNLPLYFYRSLGRHVPGDLFAREGGRLPNISEKFVREFTDRLKLKFLLSDPGDLTKTAGPEDIFHYAYTVFHSLAYRKRYAEFLKTDFPRLPLTSSLELFRALAKLGGELVALHLLESPQLDKPIAKFIGGPKQEIEKVTYARNTVWIDKSQTTGFKGVPEAVWNFHIGGYQVCEKWLKDRRTRTLSKDDIAHYQKIFVALKETIRLMSEIDKVITEHGGWPIK